MNIDRFKFRVWNEHYKSFQNNYLINSDGVVRGVVSNEELFKFSFTEEEETIEQCTGLKDCSGKLIYEGDILRHIESTPPCKHREIVWLDGAFGWLGSPSILSREFLLHEGCSFFTKDTKYILREFYIIVGNIHQNPELLDYKR